MTYEPLMGTLKEIGFDPNSVQVEQVRTLIKRAEEKGYHKGLNERTVNDKAMADLADLHGAVDAPKPSHNQADNLSAGGTL